MEQLPKRQKLPHRVPDWVKASSEFFITINCYPRGLNQLCHPEVGRGIFDAVQHNDDSGVWACRLCLLMPDHLHAILSFAQNPGMRKSVADWKRFLANTWRIQWQSDFFDHRIRSPDKLLAATQYILLNPVRKGLCETPEDWKWIWRPDNFRR